MTVVCRVGDGSTSVNVTADGIVGPYAIHQRIVKGRASGPGWAVTHRALGKVVWVVETLGEAVRVAGWLDEHRIIPEEAEAAQTWREHLSPTEYADLLTQLHGVAPRYLG